MDNLVIENNSNEIKHEENYPSIITEESKNIEELKENLDEVNSENLNNNDLEKNNNNIKEEIETNKKNQNEINMEEIKEKVEEENNKKESVMGCEKEKKEILIEKEIINHENKIKIEEKTGEKNKNDNEIQIEDNPKIREENQKEIEKINDDNFYNEYENKINKKEEEKKEINEDEFEKKKINDINANFFKGNEDNENQELNTNKKIKENNLNIFEDLKENKELNQKENLNKEKVIEKNEVSEINKQSIITFVDDSKEKEVKEENNNNDNKITNIFKEKNEDLKNSKNIKEKDIESSNNIFQSINKSIEEVFMNTNKNDENKISKENNEEIISESKGMEVEEEKKIINSNNYKIEANIEDNIDHSLIKLKDENDENNTEKKEKNDNNKNGGIIHEIKDEGVKEEIKNEEIKKEEIKKEGIEKEEIKNEEIKIEGIINKESKNEDDKNEEIKKLEIKREEIKDDEINNKETNKEELKTELKINEEIKSELIEKEEIKNGENNNDENKKEKIRNDEIKYEETKNDENKKEESWKKNIKEKINNKNKIEEIYKEKKNNENNEEEENKDLKKKVENISEKDEIQNKKTNNENKEKTSDEKKIEENKNEEMEKNEIINYEDKNKEIKNENNKEEKEGKKEKSQKEEKDKEEIEKEEFKNNCDRNEDIKIGEKNEENMDMEKKEKNISENECYDNKEQLKENIQEIEEKNTNKKEKLTEVKVNINEEKEYKNKIKENYEEKEEPKEEIEKELEENNDHDELKEKSKIDIEINEIKNEENKEININSEKQIDEYERNKEDENNNIIKEDYKDQIKEEMNIFIEEKKEEEKIRENKEEENKIKEEIQENIIKEEVNKKHIERNEKKFGEGIKNIKENKTEEINEKREEKILIIDKNNIENEDNKKGKIKIKEQNPNKEIKEDIKEILNNDGNIKDVGEDLNKDEKIKDSEKQNLEKGKKDINICNSNINNDKKNKKEKIYIGINNNHEKILEYKKSNYTKFYKEKYFCDYNTGKEWRAGFIIKINNEDYAEILDATRKNECGEKFEKMIININDSKNISYFRKYSKPDNFMVKGASQNLKKKLEQFTFFHNNFENYIKNGDNYEFYYFLRVTVYYGLDFCMNPNINKSHSDKETILVSFKLILMILEIIVDCLKYIDEHFNDFTYFQTTIKNTDLNDLVLINNKYAIFSFFDDIHFLIKKIYGDSIQYLDWYIKFENEINHFNPCTTNNPEILSIPFYIEQEENANIKNNNNNYLVKRICSSNIYNGKITIFTTLNKDINVQIISYFIDYFSYLNGYKILFQLIYSFDILTYENINIIFNIQNSLLDDIYTAKAITESFKNSHKEELIKLKEYAINYLNGFNEKNFETIKKNELIKFINKIFDLTEKDKEKNQILKENFILNYILIQLQYTKKIENRVLYLSELKKIIKSLEYNELYKKIIEENDEEEFDEEILDSKKFQNRNKEIKKMNSKYFCKVCQEKKIISICFEDNLINEKVIKRLSSLIKFMFSKNYGYSDNDKDKINEITINLLGTLVKKLSQNEENKKVWEIITRVIDDFVNFIPNENLLIVFLKIKDYFNRNKNSPRFSQIFAFLINYSLKCISKIKLENTNFDIDNINTYGNILKTTFPENKFYCLNILIIFTLSNNNFRELKINKEGKLELINILNKGIIDMLKIINNSSINQIIFTKIITAIASSVNTIQNIILLENIIDLNSKNVEFRKVIKNLCEKTNIMKSMINKFNLYFSEIGDINIKSKNKMNGEDYYNFETNIEKRLNFIFLIMNKEYEINFDFNEFVKIYKTLSIHNFNTKEILYSIIQKHISNINFELIKNIFEIILLNEKLFKITDLRTFNLLKDFIMELNISNKKFIIIYEKEMIIETNIYGNDIYGFDILWELMMKSKNKEVQNNSAIFLKDIIIGVRYSSMNEYEQFWNKIINKIVEDLQNLIENKNEENNNSIKGLIILINEIIKESVNDGNIINDKKILNGIFKSFEKNKENNGTSIKAFLEYDDKTFNNKNSTKNKKDNINTPIEINDCLIYKNEYFYQFKYYLSHEFKIPLKCIEISIKNKNKNENNNNKKEDYKLNIFNDLFNFNNFTKNLKEKEIIIIVKKINNPLSDCKTNNMKNMINSNKKIRKILTNLLKSKFVDYTNDIWNIINSFS